MDLGLSRAERAIVVAKEAARQIGVIMISDCGDIDNAGIPGRE